MFPRLKYILLFIFIPILVKSQGKSFYKTYTPKDYDAHAQNWCVIQDNDGLIYIGNTIGLLIHDSKKWTSIKLNNSIVRSLAKDINDRIYYGAQGEFGYLFADKQGNIQSKSLVSLLPDSLKLFGDVWKTYCLKNKVVFQTFDYVFVYENNKIQVIEAENYYHFAYQRDNDYYILDREIGLKKLVNSKLELVIGGEYFAKLRIYGWVNYNNYAIVATREKGLSRITFKDGTIQAEPFITEIDKEIIEGEVYCTTALSNNRIGIGTLNSGFFIIDENGYLVKVINKKDGLKSDIINACFEDRQKGLWLALDVGITRVEINGPFKYFDEQDGLEGIVNSAIKFNQQIYFGTTKGFFEMNKVGVKRVKKFSQDVSYLYNVTIDGIENLIILAESGVYKLDKNGNFVQLNNESGLFIVASRFHDYNYFLGTNSGLCILNLKYNTVKKYYDTPMPEVRRIVEENDSVLWLGTSHNGVYKVKNVLGGHFNIQPYDTSKGLPDNSFDLPFLVGNKILFGTHKGIYEYNAANDNFIMAKQFAEEYYGVKDQIYQIIEGFKDQVWLFKTNEKFHEFILYDTKTKKASFPLKRMGDYDAYQCIYPENENITWFGGNDGLFKYDASIASTSFINFKTKISSVLCNNNILFGGSYGTVENNRKIVKQTDNFIPELIYKNNNISFEYAALSFDNEKENVYSYYLEGFENNWSEWTSESKKSYTNLNEGTYTFHIKSKNVYGKEGEEDKYTFTIFPPWYRTGWSYVAYAIGAIVIVYLITQLSVRRLKSAKIKLEATVINRTAEVVAEKEEVEKQKKIVEIKNKDITDSINYAQRIQQAILPLPEDFVKVFPESFIYFQPRDIVSGDFYWFYKSKKKEHNRVYIAAADCTGHGVPGAFMSMIGNTLLNEI